MRTRGPAVLVFLLAAVVSAATPAVMVKEVTGEAAIVDGNDARAEREAKERALREAVEQVAGVLISADTLTQNNQLISDRIFANSGGYIRKYDVLSKKKDKGVMSVMVRAEVGAAKLDKDLAAVQGLVARHGNRQLVVLLQEQAIDSKGVTTSSGVMSTVLTDAFKKDGWTLIDPSFASGKLKLTSGVSLGASEAKEIGDLTRAEYILYGTVNFRYQPPTGIGDVDAKGQPLLFYVTGEYDLALFATDSGSQLAKVSGKFETKDVGKKGTATVSYERTAHDISLSHGQKVVGQVRGAAVEHLRSGEVNGSRVVMKVSGLKDYAQVQDFRKALAALGNVKAVKAGRFGKGEAQFDVTYVGSTDDLAGDLGTTAFKRRKLSVTGVTANTVDVSVSK